MNRLQLRASARFKLFALFVPLMLLAVIACNIGEVRWTPKFGQVAKRESRS